MLPSWANETITRLRPKSQTLRGSVVPDWSNPNMLVIGGCSVQPAGSMLSQDGRIQGITDGLTCYIPPGTDVQSGDRIRWIHSVCKSLGITVNVSTDRKKSDFYFPGIARKGDLVAGVTASGKDHAAAREASERIRALFEEL